MDHLVDGAGCPGRRAVLLGLSSAGLAVLAACTTDGGAPTRPGTAGSATRPGSAGAESAAATPGSSGPAGALVRTSEVPLGGAVLVGDRLVAQPQPGVFKAYSSRCPHQGSRVDPGPAGADVLTCPAHNSTFRLGDGSLVSGPADRGLDQVPVKVSDDFVILA